MIYFGQEVGEDGSEDAGFGKPSRTSIFDYIGVPAHQRWVNDKKFDGGQLSEDEKALRDFYKRLLNFTIGSSALMGPYREIHYLNKEKTDTYDHRLFSYVRWSEDEKLIIISNFDAERAYDFELKVPSDILETWGLDMGRHELEEQLYGRVKTQLLVASNLGKIPVKLQPLESLILKVME